MTVKRDAFSIRRSIRARRRSLSNQEYDAAAQQIARHLTRHPLFLRSQHIAAYLPVSGEANLEYVVQRAWSINKSVCLPVLAPARGKLWFLPYSPKSALARNRYAIPEPDSAVGCRRPLIGLDLVLVPLIAFDLQGHRLGMGGGYYDRSFEFLLRRRLWKKPVLLGVGYQFQQLDSLASQSWDVPLDGVVTEQGVQIFHRPRC